jgi:hypothetical protein
MATDTQATPVTPSQVTETNAAQLVASRLAEHERRLNDSLDIRDPSVPRDAPAPSDSTPAKTQDPTTIAGAKPDGGITSDLLDRAAQVGLTAEDAKGLTPAALLRTVGILESRQYEPEPEYEPEPQPQWTPDAYLESLNQQLPSLQGLKAEDGSEFDPSLIGAVSARDQAYQRELAALHQQNQALAAQQQQFIAQQQARETEQQHRSLEGLIAKDEDYKDVLGDGPASSLVGTRHFQTRLQIANAMDDLAAGYRNRRQVVPDTETLYQKAKLVVVGARQPKVTVDKMRNSSGQFISRPTATTRNGEATDPTSRAIAAVAAKLRERSGF